MGENLKLCLLGLNALHILLFFPFFLICKQAQRFFYALKQASSLMKLAMA